ncbi:MAG: DNA polymerase III subunit chi [Gammaproteobacteria bacterium]|jgi:DNA polymerase-3 subunit chi|nr:DNA polymerase III subunit chi [Gammaproteobacteria bacterium]
MTRVGFYVVQSPQVSRRLEIAMRLTEKAFQQGHRIFINAEDRPQAEQLDEKLWGFRAGSFLPHALLGSDDSSQIAIGWGQEPSDHSDLLINLQLDVPPFFSRFNRVAEVVTQDPQSLAALRSSWKFYKERGYQLEKHDL